MLCKVVIIMKNTEFHTVRGYQLLIKSQKLLTPAMEDYLEMIYRNSQQEGFLRINRLADLLHVKPSSATKMVQKLTEMGLLDYEKYGIIFLTESGKTLGRFLLNRHNIIEKFLSNIGISENLLIETELIEHNVSANTLKSIDQFNRFVEMYPEFVREFENFKNTVYNTEDLLEP